MSAPYLHQRRESIVTEYAFPLLTPDDEGRWLVWHMYRKEIGHGR